MVCLSPVHSLHLIASLPETSVLTPSRTLVHLGGINFEHYVYVPVHIYFNVEHDPRIGHLGSLCGIPTRTIDFYSAQNDCGYPCCSRVT